MRRLVIVAVLVIVASVAYRGLPGEAATTGTGTLTLSQPSPSPGEDVSPFEAERMNGEKFEMPDEGTYVISFWSGLNQGSVDASPAFERLAEEYEGSEVSFAAVYVGSVPSRDQDGAPYAVIKDESGRLTSLYNVKRVPRLFLIEDGVVKVAQDNFYEDNQREMKEALESVTQADDQ